MCNKEKQLFAQTIGKHKSYLVRLANHDFVAATVDGIKDDLATRAAKYGTDVKKFVRSGSSVRPNSSEQSSIQSDSDKTRAAYKKATMYATAAKKKANVRKAMLLQIGQ